MGINVASFGQFIIKFVNQGDWRMFISYRINFFIQKSGFPEYKRFLSQTTTKEYFALPIS